jgi:hypothetical protein
MSSFIVLSYASSKIWQEHEVAQKVVQHAVAGRYGFTPQTMHINGQDKGRTVDDKAVDHVVTRIRSGNVQSLDLVVSGVYEVPYASLTLGRGAASTSMLSVEIPLGTQRLVEISEEILRTTHAEYLSGHEKKDWKRLHDERRGHRLFVPGRARGAHWLTYFCAEYTDRLGGADTLRAAPVLESRGIDGGILLVSHPDPGGMGDEPRRSEIERLQQYLQDLVKPEERP